ncbi:hypothetical protein [Vreelandella titanicae]|uniref:hypothetical protein n=1 Tax=Vreelandella titanicae TaxID=664683 RepID=UPI003FD6D23B
MANYKLIDYNLMQGTTSNGINCLVLELEMENSNGNIDKRSYTLLADDNYTSLQTIDGIVRTGLTEAKTKGLKIGVSDFEARFYVTLSLPSSNKQSRRSKEDYRFTAHKQ